MPTELINALKMVADEKAIDIDDLIETIQQAVAHAAEKRLNRDNLEAAFDREKGAFDLYENLVVRSAVENPHFEVGLEEAVKIDPDAEIGSTVRRQVEMEGLGRIAAQSVRQMIHKKGRELEMDRLAERYRSKIGEITTGRLIRKARDGHIFELDEIEAILPSVEQLAMDHFERGRHVKFLIVDMRSGKSEPLVVVSRNHPDLLRRMLEIETPELADGSVEIVAVARDPLGRSKVAVRSTKPEIDPVGACVGVRGGRIQPVVREFNGEKIDIFAWSDDPKRLIAAALTPARDGDVFPDAKEKKAIVIVPDSQLSPAIGKKGVNIKLAVKVTGWEMDVVSRKEYEARKKFPETPKSGENRGETSGAKSGASGAVTIASPAQLR